MEAHLVYTSPSSPAPLSATEEASAHVALMSRRGSTSIDSSAPEAKRPRSIGPTGSGYFSDSLKSSPKTSSQPSSLEEWLKSASSSILATRASNAKGMGAASREAVQEEQNSSSRPRLNVSVSMPVSKSTSRRATPPPAPTPANLEEEPASPRPSALPSRFDARPGTTRAFTAPTARVGPSSGIDLVALRAKALARGQAIAAATDVQYNAMASDRASEYISDDVSKIAESLNKDRFVAGLVGASVLAIESIWGSSVPTPAETAAAEGNVLPLHWFVKEVLRRSRTSCSTLQLALYYLHKSRRIIRETVARAELTRNECARVEARLRRNADLLTGDSNTYPSPPLSPTDTEFISDEQRYKKLLEAQQSPLLCGRRMFLASLIAASKYLQDRNYSNRAWARISGLPVHEINLNERAFLNMIGFSLHLDAADFQRWCQRLSSLTVQGAQLESAAATPLLSCHVRSQSDLPAAERTLSEGPVLQRCPADTSGVAARLQHARRQEQASKGKVGEPRQQPSPEDSDDGSVNSSDDAASCSSSSTGGRKVRALPKRRAGVPLTRSKPSPVRGTAPLRLATRSSNVTADIEGVTQQAAALSWSHSSNTRSRPVVV